MKEPRDPTIAEKFNTYRSADYKEKVMDLLAGDRSGDAVVTKPLPYA